MTVYNRILLADAIETAAFVHPSIAAPKNDSRPRHLAEQEVRFAFRLSITTTIAWLSFNFYTRPILILERYFTDSADVRAPKPVSAR